MVEILGYAGLVFLVASLSRKNIMQLRILSCFGTLAFFIQALLLESASLMLTNVLIMGIHIYMIVELKKA